jgi:ABC-type amino acid transport substrate-binding protein|tara:strand:+ start:533 stop:727 length:195 start_codon:yes stop_codon:yes gene_type:complete
MNKSEAGFIKAMARELLVASVASGRELGLLLDSDNNDLVGRDIRIALAIAKEFLQESPESEDNQ